MERKSGILLSISSLPSRHGVGCFSKDAYQFIDLLKKGGFSLWQILPLNPIGYGHSPYQPYSSFAIDELYIDLDQLTERGLLERVPPIHEDFNSVCYEDIRTYKNHFLFEAFNKEFAGNFACLDKFIRDNKWVKEYAAFAYFKKLNNGVSWDNWPDEHKNWIDNKQEINDFKYLFEIWLQKEAYSQYLKLHEYAKKQGIKIIGDIPFYVGYDSLDVWSNKKSFLLGENYKPTFIAGVPPDYFSKTGQRWGNPIYNWDYLKETNYEFLINRIVGNSKLYGIIRLDHFRAFDTYWKIPSSCETAIEGEWALGPSADFFNNLKKVDDTLEIIAEDLGDLRKEVYELRDEYKLPGMNVVQFSFNDAEVYKTVNWNKENQVIYIGTHDNETFNSFFKTLDEEMQLKWLDSLKDLGFAGKNVTSMIVEYTLNHISKYAILDMQDVLGLGSESRMNVPGVIDNFNWTWKLSSFEQFKDLIPQLFILNKKYKRI